jgi:hypothetical protein
VKVTLEATSTVDTVGGKIPARIWVGATESGIPVKAWLAVIRAETDDETALAEFDRELRSVPASREFVSFDIRMALP